MTGGYKVYNFHGSGFDGYHKGIYDFVNSNNKITMLENVKINHKPQTLFVSFAKDSSDTYVGVAVVTQKTSAVSETYSLTIDKDDNCMSLSF